MHAKGVRWGSNGACFVRSFGGSGGSSGGSEYASPEPLPHPSRTRPTTSRGSGGPKKIFFRLRPKNMKNFFCFFSVISATFFSQNIFMSRCHADLPATVPGPVAHPERGSGGRSPGVFWRTSALAPLPSRQASPHARGARAACVRGVGEGAWWGRQTPLPTRPWARFQFRARRPAAPLAPQPPGHGHTTAPMLQPFPNCEAKGGQVAPSTGLRDRPGTRDAVPFCVFFSPGGWGCLQWGLQYLQYLQ